MGSGHGLEDAAVFRVMADVKPGAPLTDSPVGLLTPVLVGNSSDSCQNGESTVGEGLMITAVGVAPGGILALMGDINSLPEPDCPRLPDDTIIPCTDGVVTSADAAFMLTHLFVAPQTLACPALADLSGNGQIGVEDAIWLLNHIILGGPPPVAIPDPSWSTHHRCREQSDFDDFVSLRGSLGCSLPTPCTFYLTD